ncbi:MAG: hypothetical protein ACR2NI_04440 [Pirellulales bacterium]
MPNYDLIESSDELADARTYGYYVREQIEAHGTHMPAWFVEDLVAGAGWRTNEAVYYLLEVVGLKGILDPMHLEIALEAITVRSMDLRMFSEFIQTIVQDSLDEPEDKL